MAETLIENISDLIIHLEVGDPGRRNLPGPDPRGSAGLGNFRQPRLDYGRSSEVAAARNFAGHHVDTAAPSARNGLVVVVLSAVTITDVHTLLIINIYRSKKKTWLAFLTNLTFEVFSVPKSGESLPWLEKDVFLELSESHSPRPESTLVISFSSLDLPDNSLSSGMSSRHERSKDRLIIL